MTPLFSPGRYRDLHRLRRFVGWPKNINLVIMVVDQKSKTVYEAELARLDLSHIKVQCIDSLQNGSKLTFLGKDEASKLE